MRRFASSTARASRRLVGFLKAAFLCFGTVEDEDMFKEAPLSEDPSSTTEELDETPFCVGVEKASQQLNEMMTEELMQPGLRNMQLVSLSKCSSSSNRVKRYDLSVSWDTRSADEEIDVSGLAPSLQPPRTFEVKMLGWREAVEKLKIIRKDCSVV